MAAAAAEEGQVISCHNIEQWKQLFQTGIDSNKLVVVDFTASWCGPCRVISPLLSETAKKMPSVMFLKVDVDELSSVAEEWKVEAMPTFIFFIQGNLVDTVVGAKKEELLHTIAKHATVIPA